MVSCSNPAGGWKVDGSFDDMETEMKTARTAMCGWRVPTMMVLLLAPLHALLAPAGGVGTAE